MTAPNLSNPLKASLLLDLNSASGNCTIHTEEPESILSSPTIITNTNESKLGSAFSKLLLNFSYNNNNNNNNNNIVHLTRSNSATDLSTEKSNDSLSNKEAKRMIALSQLTSRKSPSSSMRSRRMRAKTTINTSFYPLSFLTGVQQKRKSILIDPDEELCFLCSSKLNCTIHKQWDQYNLSNQLFVQMDELDHLQLEI